MLRSLCRQQQRKALRKLRSNKAGRLYASAVPASGAHDSHGVDAHHDHHLEPLKIKEWVPMHLQEGAQERISKVLANLSNTKEYASLEKAVSSKAYLQCLAEINTTELNDIGNLNASKLLSKYRDQKANFETSVVPQLKKEGHTDTSIAKLQELYELRVRVNPDDLAELVTRFQILTLKYPKIAKLRATHSEHVNIFARFFQLNSVGLDYWMQPEPNNEESIVNNINRIRGWKALSQAFRRGLSELQYQHVKGVLSKASVPQDVKNTLQAQAAIFKQLKFTDKKKASEHLEKVLEKYPNQSNERQYLLELLAESFEAPGASQVEGLVHRSPYVAPFTPHVGGELALTVENIHKALEEAEKGETDPNELALLQKVKGVAKQLFTPTVSRNVELYGLLRAADLEPEDVDALYSIFLKEDDPSVAADLQAGITTDLLRDALHPNALAAKLWGDKIQWKTWDHSTYLRTFKDLDGGMFHRVVDGDRPDPADTHHDSYHDQKHLAVLRNYVADRVKESDISITMAPFATAYDDIYHQKLLRLANEYYNFDLDSDVGLIQFDLFMHAYDVSPGEDFLDRVHPYPTPEHTYEELPIIKFDGYEESDDPDVHAHSHGHKH